MLINKILTSDVKIDVGSYTEAGDVKTTNQDSVLSLTKRINNHSVGLFVVADGCGGLAYGEEISNLITLYFNSLWNTELKEELEKSNVNDDNINRILDKTIYDINVKALAFSRQVNKQVGSTLSLLFTIDKRYFIKNMGDSRIYVINKNKIKQLTQDQSLVADMLRNKEISEEEAKHHKKKNILTMCIGIFHDIKIYRRAGKIKKNDIFMVCCDGLYNYLSEEKILLIASEKNFSMDEKAKQLRRMIPKGNAKDNVSVILAQYSWGWLW